MSQLEEDGLWHVNGRKERKRPILLLKQGYFVEHRVEHYHVSTPVRGLQEL